MAFVYIALPDGWNFEGKKELPEGKKDVLVQHPGTQIIYLQDIIKDCLRCKKRNIPSMTIELKNLSLESITIYFKSPPHNDELYIQYEPQNNAKYPAEKVNIAKGVEFANSKTVQTVYGQRWYNMFHFSEEKMAEIKAADKEQRDNRRHIGDSPYAT
ncbi:hypothetical protein A8135_10475 [Legionella jamestowniensis]|uniref:Permease n=1 Tax=Legionella jamestowniensis TaxID=455 RepID=A0ABX2XVQ7_9GAMM|nr:hypothetical protein [Legionella jamestowniensis]OCH98722.1 hypothetical protein A8135_10475 [Legionella jamestowniensis]